MSWSNQIQQRVPPKIINRAENYYNQGRVLRVIQRDGEYEARVSGSRPASYRVKISTTNDGQLESTFCDCPDDWNPICKHITAVALAYEHDPEIVETRQPPEQDLADLSREELLQLVRMMLDHEPSLRQLLDHPLPGQSTRSDDLGDPDQYRGEIQDILDRYGEPGMNRERAREFGNVTARVEKYLEHENYDQAYALLRAFLEEIIEFHDRVHDLEFISSEIESGAKFVGPLLEAFSNSPENRKTLLEFLYSLYEWSVVWGGYGIDENMRESLLDHATQRDRPRLRELIRTSIRDLGEDRLRWTGETLGELLLELHRKDDQEEEFLEDARNLGLWKLMTECLISREQIRKALGIAREELNDVNDQIHAANRLLDLGYIEEAGELVNDLLDQRRNHQLRKWLSEYEEQYGQTERALELEWKRMEDRPGFDRYERIMNLAEELDRVEEIESNLLEFLRNQDETKILALVHLEKENWDQAWEHVEILREKQGHRYVSVAEKAARKSGRDRPRRAIDYYKERARQLIKQRGRGNYREAAEYLQKIRTLFEETEVENQWPEIVEQFYQQASNLPACRDEFSSAGIDFNGDGSRSTS